ncbi:MAG: hypothetical protein WBA66_04175, partial [Xanthobacteraceae bacterium]
AAASTAAADPMPPAMHAVAATNETTPFIIIITHSGSLHRAHDARHDIARTEEEKPIRLVNSGTKRIHHVAARRRILRSAFIFDEGRTLTVNRILPTGGRDDVKWEPA